MGGMFSGRRYWEISTRKKKFTSEFSSIDSLEIHKTLYEADQNGCLDAVRWNMFYLSFKFFDKKGFVYFIGYANYQGVSFSVNLDSTPCFYGGCRCWFRCGYCDRRVRFLYFKKGNSVLSVACRTCHNLSYQSQNRSFSDRIIDKRRKIWKKLGSQNEQHVKKPKGMHAVTYNNLCILDSKLTSLSLRAFILKIKSYK